MKWLRQLKVFCAALLLTGCFAPALLMTSQAQLMGELLRPLVGFNPLDVKLFDNPLIKDRMVALMGEDNYRTATTLLYTATALQVQGPLYFVTSEHSPLPHLAEKAGFVWNSEHNQMAILLVSGGKTEIFAEAVNSAAGAVVPSWPKDLVDYTSPDKLKQKAIGGAISYLGLEGDQAALAEAALSGGSVENVLEQQIKDQVPDPIEEIKQKVEAGQEELLAAPKQRFNQMVQEAVPTDDDVVKQFTGKTTAELEQAKALKKQLDEAKARAAANVKAAQQQPVKDKATLQKEAQEWAKKQAAEKAKQQVKPVTQPVDDLLEELKEETGNKTSTEKKKTGG
ncbi:hypothetical protein ACFO3I_15845 [Rheinheimera marina]|uniref:Uncharacterized protein n=1 Tax=Rheinheimera marina TaxID=1774958 RepID=A0ABV9JQE2_9GAMM